MKKLFRTASALAAFLAIASAWSWAQEKAPPAKPASRPPASFLTGTIEAFDEAKGTLTVKSRKGGVKEFAADERARDQMKALKVGDKVVVKHSDGTAHSIVKPGIKKKEPPQKEAAQAETRGASPAAGRK